VDDIGLFVGSDFDCDMYAFVANAEID
jgi:hypothetical protein